MLKVVPNSKNSKLGPGVGASYRPVDISCPSSCRFLPKESGGNGGCYASRGRTAISARRSEHDSGYFQHAHGVSLFRHLVSGDAFKRDKNGKRRILDREYVQAVFQFHRASKFTTGWGYTHNHKAWDSAGFSPDIHPVNLTMLASCDDVEATKVAQSAGWRTARVSDGLSDSETMTELNEIYCPVDMAKHLGKDQRTTCAACRKCFDDSGKNIVFIKF